MAGSATVEGVQALMESRYRGGTAIYALATEGTLSATSTVADAIAEEILDMPRLVYAPAVSTVTGRVISLPSTTVVLTNGGVSPVSVGAIALIHGGKASGGGAVTTISVTTITRNAHGLANNDTVIFTNDTASAPTNLTLSTPGSITTYFVVNATTNTFGISVTQGGSAISLGSSWTGTLNVRCTNGVIDPGYINSAQTISAGQDISATFSKASFTVT